MYLDQAKITALQLLRRQPSGAKQISPSDHGWAVWLGIGYAVAKGWAVYRGDHHYEITEAGIDAWRELMEIEQ